MPDQDIEHRCPPALERNRGIQEVMYLEPTFPEFLCYEYSPQHPVPYQAPFSEQDRVAAISRDRLSHRAWWSTNLSLLEIKKEVLEGKKLDLERRLRVHLKTAMESQSNLGSGYTDYTFLHG